ncbi:hypothetical protein U1Q18_047916, partial [Sarracenia purpurea var. burkii]
MEDPYPPQTDLPSTSNAVENCHNRVEVRKETSIICGNIFTCLQTNLDEEQSDHPVCVSEHEAPAQQPIPYLVQQEFGVEPIEKEGSVQSEDIETASNYFDEIGQVVNVTRKEDKQALEYLYMGLLVFPQFRFLKGAAAVGLVKDAESYSLESSARFNCLIIWALAAVLPLLRKQVFSLIIAYYAS